MGTRGSWAVGTMWWRAGGCLAALLMPAVAHAFPINAPLVPNTALAFSEIEGREQVCITCHNNPDGGQGCEAPPCWNLFGDMFGATYSKQWGPELAAEDADGDGFTNGQELQDPAGSWQVGQPKPGYAGQVTRPGFADDTPGDADFDGDTYCFFGRDLNIDGDCKDPGENAGGAADRDCDDSDFFAHSGASEDCTNPADNDCDGEPTLTDDECADVVDNDLDGFCETGQDLNGDRLCLDDEQGALVDCDDGAPTVYPGAPVNCVDGLDNDCDTLVDLDDVDDCNQEDEDQDGWCPYGRDLNDDHDCLDPGETDPLPAYDCNDDRDDINPGATEVCTDQFDNDCVNGADFVDPACRHLVDGDGDGVCPAGLDLNADGNCAGDAEQDECPGGVCSSSAIDCDDDDVLRAPTFAEDCTDTVRDVDCDGNASVSFTLASSSVVLGPNHDADCSSYVDFDGDGYCEGGEDGTGGVYDRDCIDAAESIGIPDCADDPAADGALQVPGTTEQGLAQCSDGLDNDCDSLVDFADRACFEWADRDGDGFCPTGTDLDGDGGCTGVGEAATGASDCDDTDPLIAPGAPENCIDGKDNDCDGRADFFQGRPDISDEDCSRDVDADGDGFCPFGVDVNGDGDCLDDAMGEGVRISDCDDASAAQHPLAAETTAGQCSDGRDNDCDGYIDLADNAESEQDYLRAMRPTCRAFLDGDGDTYCPSGRDLNFNHSCLDTGEQMPGVEDCDDTTILAYPGRRESCDDGIDNDCNLKTDLADYPQCQCSADADCDDGDACTSDRCSARGECLFEAACSDAGADAGMLDAAVEVDAGADAEVGDASGPPDTDDDAGTAPGERSKSGCAAHPLGSGGAPAAWCVLGVLMWTAQRRRRRPLD